MVGAICLMTAMRMLHKADIIRTYFRNWQLLRTQNSGGVGIGILESWAVVRESDFHAKRQVTEMHLIL